MAPFSNFSGVRIKTRKENPYFEKGSMSRAGRLDGGCLINSDSERTEWPQEMKQIVLTLLLAPGVAISMAQTPAKPGAPAKTSVAAKAAASTSSAQLPPGVPRVHGIVKTAFSLRYEDIKIGTGAEAEPGKLYKVLYTGWLAADGKKFDSSNDHRAPVMGADGKPELDENGKAKLADPQPINVPQGYGRVIPGFDQGFNGMKVGGKRRLFIPWQLAYGARGRPPVIPPKSDLIFDIELVDVSDLQMPASHPAMPGMGGMPMGHPPVGQPGAPGTSTAPTSPGTQAAPPTPGTQSAPATPAPPATPPPADKPQQKQ
jgi:peptidylprolyl isomerase